MDNQEKTNEELRIELQELKRAYDDLKNSYEADINKRMQIEEELSESERKYRLLAQNSSDVIWTLDNEYHFTYISPSIYQLRGLTPEEAMRETIQETMTPDSQEIVTKAILDGIENEKVKNYIPQRVEIEQYHKDGHLIWVEISNRAMINDNGEKIGYIGISRDISKRKISENALRQSEAKLLELNAQKDKFFSIIAHDLKSPFSSIMGFSELLVDKINKNDFRGIEKYAQIIGQSSQQAMDLLMNLLEWSRSQTGRMEFKPENFDLHDLINENKSIFDVIASQKKITIHENLPSELSVFADKLMISTVLRNLISNAIKFTKQDGEIRISAEKKSKEIHIYISDNGVGIKEKRLKNLFRIDENESTSGTNNEKGTGLGLILCKEFVEKHGGKIWVESEEGKGSTFYFSLMSSVN